MTLVIHRYLVAQRQRNACEHHSIEAMTSEAPKLFNEGNYRTATFHISLCDTEGQAVDSQSAVGDSELFVRLEVERPPFTPDFLYRPETMNTMFLTTECDILYLENRPNSRFFLSA